jgi:hypothetical protein
MAVLKVWNGTAWVAVGGTNDAIHPVGAVAPSSPATGTVWLDTSTTPAYVQKGANGEILLDTTGQGSVGRMTRLSGPEEDVHLRSGDGAGSAALIEAASNAYLIANGLFDGTAWQRFNVANKIAMAAVGENGVFQVLDAPAGANPATLTTRLSVSSIGASGMTQIATPALAPFIGGNGVAHYTSNLYHDGTNWMRYNTSAWGMLLRIGSDNGAIELYYAAPGANPVTFSSYTLTNAAARPQITQSALGSYAAYSSGWSSYGAPYTSKIVRDQIGVVRINGLVTKSTAIGANDVMFTLNGNFRPQADMIFPLVTATGIVEARMAPTGSCYVVTAPAGANGWVALDGIPSFYAYS